MLKVLSEEKGSGESDRQNGADAPTNVEQKVAVVVEHFHSNVRDRIGGKAKAMVVTHSRLQAVRFRGKPKGTQRAMSKNSLGSSFSNLAFDFMGKPELVERASFPPGSYSRLLGGRILEGKHKTLVKQPV